MLENSFGLTFFLKTPRKKNNVRLLYLRVTVDGIPKETSTKRRWDLQRWDQKIERAIGNKEDARTINFFLESLELKISLFKTELMNNDHTITSQKIIDHVNGKIVSKTKVLEEFQLHNDEILELVPKEYAIGTYERYVTARCHVKEFMKLKYGLEDMEFRELNYQFIKNYEHYLKTVRACSNNTTLKYISNFKKIILIAIDKEIIAKDPFSSFKGKKTKILKRPLSSEDLHKLELQNFHTERLAMVRDVFIFQCYTGLAYIDAFQLKKCDIKIGCDGEYWIMSARQKTKSETFIPLLPTAVKIMDKYKDHPICIKRSSVLPVSSNQKMNEYLKEIASLCGFSFTLNTHKARRTFASTITLNNNVPINVVKEMLGHQSVRQTEDYAITEQQTVSREMAELKDRLEQNRANSKKSALANIGRLQKEIDKIKQLLKSEQNL
jgi:site-specific recombinase XerD